MPEETPPLPEAAAAAPHLQTDRTVQTARWHTSLTALFSLTAAIAAASLPLCGPDERHRALPRNIQPGALHLPGGGRTADTLARYGIRFEKGHLLVGRQFSIDVPEDLPVRLSCDAMSEPGRILLELRWEDATHRHRFRFFIHPGAGEGEVSYILSAERKEPPETRPEERLGKRD